MSFDTHPVFGSGAVQEETDLFDNDGWEYFMRHGVPKDDQSQEDFEFSDDHQMDENFGEISNITKSTISKTKKKPASKKNPAIETTSNKRDKAIVWTESLNNILVDAVCKNKAYKTFDTSKIKKSQGEKWVRVVNDLIAHPRFSTLITECNEKTLQKVQKQFARLRDQIKGRYNLECEGENESGNMQFDAEWMGIVYCMCQEVHQYEQEHLLEKDKKEKRMEYRSHWAYLLFAI
jgi:hypothetical protein